MLVMQDTNPTDFKVLHYEAVAGCFRGQFQEIHQQEWVELINQMLCFFAEEFKVPRVLALFDYVQATLELCPP